MSVVGVIGIVAFSIMVLILFAYLPYLAIVKSRAESGRKLAGPIRSGIVRSTELGAFGYRAYREKKDDA